MKSKLPLFAVIAVVALVFSSCKSLTNFSIEKRQHRGGYYVDWGNGKVKTDAARPAVSAARQETPAKQKAASVPAENPVNAGQAVEKQLPSATTKAAEKTTKDAASIRHSFKVKDDLVAQRVQSDLEPAEYNFSNAESYFEKQSSDTPDWVLAVLCILLPPLAVFLKVGIGSEFWISILLTLLFWIPGVIYAFIICF